APIPQAGSAVPGSRGGSRKRGDRGRSACDGPWPHGTRRAARPAADTMGALDDPAPAMELADAPDRISMDRLPPPDPPVDRKPALSPVTEADQAIEHEMRERVQRDRPGHSVLGEEHGLLEGGGEWRWVVDPIDGTRSYARGNETWATLIALQHAGSTQLA